MTKSKKNLAIMVAFITLLVALGSVFAIFGIFAKPTKTVEAAELTEAQLAERRANPGLYETGTTTLIQSWDSLMSNKKITISYGRLSTSNLAGDLVCGEVEGLTSLVDAFNSCSKITALDLSNLDTSNITDMNGMFAGCSVLTSIIFGDNFSTSKATNMRMMFSYCKSLTTLDLSSFNTSKVTDMQEMFGNCSSLTSITFGNKFDTSNVTNMSDMFSSCSSLVILDVSHFNTSNVTNMSGMFGGCSSARLTLGKKFTISKYSGLFEYYESKDNKIYQIVCPQMADGITISLAPATNTHYALASDPTATITELSSATNGKILKLYYDDTNIEVPTPIDLDTPSTGVATDITMIIIALASILSLAVVLTKKKRMTR